MCCNTSQLFLIRAFDVILVMLHMHQHGLMFLILTDWRDIRLCNMTAGQPDDTKCKLTHGLQNRTYSGS